VEPAILVPHILDRKRTPFKAADLWGAAPVSVEHVADGASFTFRIRLKGKTHYLRLTPPGWQSLPNIKGELSFIEAVRRSGISTPRPISSRNGELVERVRDRGQEFLAVVFEEAIGKPIEGREWDELRVNRLGRLLAELHLAAPTSLPAGESRRDWSQEIVGIARWLPKDETHAHHHVGRLTAWFESLPKSVDCYGLVHFDLYGENVLWRDSSPSVIDFDDSMFNWFAADIARALGSFKDEEPARRSAIKAWLLEGYCEVRPLDLVSAQWLPEFIRLVSIGSLAWLLYSRSYGRADEGAPEHERILRQLVNDPAGWST
jgi:Ser/Thr protein kinase RdoA (MazF antagonist)